MQPWLSGPIKSLRVLAVVEKVRPPQPRTRRQSCSSFPWSAQVKKAVIFLGRLGYGALGVVFTLIGFFMIVAAAQFNPHQAKGLDTALGELLQLRPFGPVLLGIVALGLIAYGVYSFVEARYRRLGRA
jgi:hypothetical protein